MGTTAGADCPTCSCCLRIAIWARSVCIWACRSVALCELAASGTVQNRNATKIAAFLLFISILYGECEVVVTGKARAALEGDRVIAFLCVGMLFRDDKRRLRA